MILVVVLYAILALTFVIAKEALFWARPFFLIGFRMVVAGFLLLTYQFLIHRNGFIVKKEDRLLFLKTALFHIYLAFILEFWALQRLTSSKVNIIYSSTPFIAAFLAYLLLGERLTAKKKLGMIIGILGLLPVIIYEAIPGEFAEIFKISTPELVLFCAVISAAYAWFLVKRLLDKGYSLLMINGIAMFIGGVLAFATSLIAEVIMPMLQGNKVVLIDNGGKFLFWTFLLIITANVIVYNLYGWLLKRYSITFVMFAGFLCPIFGGFFGWYFLQETITWHYIASLLCVACALLLFYQEELRLGHK